MNVLQSLTELYNSQDIDSIYRELALKILGNLDQMRRVTIYDIAELTNSGICKISFHPAVLIS